MKILLIRHGETPGNALRRYIGRTDEPLSPRGAEAARQVPCRPEVEEVFVTPLVRTRETAAILFPNARQVVLEELREMDFGVFEGRSADEMAQDPAYRAWVDSGCLDACPGGESMSAFSRRVCDRFARTVEALEGRDEAIFVVHGGVIMAVLERFGRPKRAFYDYRVKNCGGYCCTTGPGEEGLAFTLTEITPA